MAFPRYEVYRDSGVDWLGGIPDHWELKKTKFLWRELEDRSIDGEEQLLSVSQYNGITPKDDESRSESLVDYKKCRAQDLVVNIMLAWMGGLGVTDFDGIVSPAYCVYRQKENHNSKYLNYLYRTPVYLAEFARRSKGVVPSRWRMYTEDFGQVLSLLPPRDEQDRISNFLDQKTAEIDEAIAKKQRLIELLKEQKAILINQAVTKGLNPDVPMRDSGVEWIGEVPAHWEVCRIKHGVKKITKGTTPSTEGKGFVDEGIRYFKAENIVDNEICLEPAYFIDDRTDRILSRSQLKSGDVLFVIAGATIGKTAVLSQEHTPSNTNQAVCLLRPSKFLFPEYLHLWLQSNFLENYIRVNAVQSAQPNISMEDLGNINMPMPPIIEQQSIVRELEKLVEPVVRLLKYQQHVIDHLSELRSIIISESITGKIKI